MFEERLTQNFIRLFLKRFAHLFLIVYLIFNLFQIHSGLPLNSLLLLQVDRLIDKLFQLTSQLIIVRLPLLNNTLLD